MGDRTLYFSQLYMLSIVVVWRKPDRMTSLFGRLGVAVRRHLIDEAIQPDLRRAVRLELLNIDRCFVYP